jgi:large repetitive protein
MSIRFLKLFSMIGVFASAVQISCSRGVVEPEEPRLAYHGIYSPSQRYGPCMQGGAIDYNYYLGKWKTMPDFERLKADGDGWSLISLESTAPRKNDFAMFFLGNIVVPESGTYTFYLLADDSAVLYIDGIEVVSVQCSNGKHERAGRIRLFAGDHVISVCYLQRGGGMSLEASWEGPNFPKEEIDSYSAIHDAPQPNRERGLFSTNGK